MKICEYESSNLPKEIKLTSNGQRGKAAETRFDEIYLYGNESKVWQYFDRTCSFVTSISHDRSYLKSRKIPTLIGNIAVHCAFLRSLCGLKATQRHMKHSLSQNLHFTCSNWTIRPAEVTKNISGVKGEGEGAIDHNKPGISVELQEPRVPDKIRSASNCGFQGLPPNYGCKSG